MKYLLSIVSIYPIAWFLVIIYKATSNNISGEPEEKTVSNNSHFPDDPISDDGEDRLGRLDFVDGLYNQVIEYPFLTSFVFGLYGKWGEGKTSVLNLLNRRLERNDKYIVFNFDPWNFSSEEALVKGFYRGLYQAFNEKFFLPNFKKLLSKYQDVFTSGLKLSGVNIDIFWRDYSGEKLKIEIENLIETTGKRLIILIDDIDRLQSKEEIHQVFKLTKLSAEFKKTIFILSFDPDVVQRFFEKEGATDREFLAKIIQAPIHLPPADRSLIDKFLYYSNPDENHTSAIDQLLQQLEFNQEKIRIFEKEFSDLYDTDIKRFIRNLRDAKRYLNRLYQTLPAVKSEVRLADFFILELIGGFYPEVYDDIWINSWYYLPLWGEKTGASPLAYLDEKIKKEMIKAHVDTLLEGLPHKDSLRNLISAVFFKVGEVVGGNFSLFSANITNEDALKGKRLTHPDVFPKYFLLKTPIGDLPDETIETLISTWNELKVPDCEKSFFDAFKKFQEEKKGIHFFLKLITYVSNFNQNSATAVVSAIYKNIAFISGERRELSLHSKFHKARGLLLALVNEKISPPQIEEFLTKVIEETPSFVLAVSVVRSCGNTGSGSWYKIYENIAIDRLQQKLSVRLNQHFIIENRNIFEEEPVSYGSILSIWGGYSQEDKRKVNDYVMNLIGENHKYIGTIVNSYIRFSDQIEYTSLVNLYNENWLYSKIKANYSGSYFDEKEKSAVDIFLEVYEERNPSSLSN